MEILRTCSPILRKKMSSYPGWLQSAEGEGNPAEELHARRVRTGRPVENRRDIYGNRWEREPELIRRELDHASEGTSALMH
jgi:hypothetical protein